MRKLTYLVASTVDGRIGGPDGGDPTAWFSTEGSHMAALFQDYPECLPGAARDALGITGPNRLFDTVLQGRGSYRLGAEHGVHNAYPHLTNYVFSRTLTEIPDPTVHLVGSDPLEAVRTLKSEPGLGIWLCGGGRLAGLLLPEIDELVIKLHPIVAGDGIPLFGDAGFEPRYWDLTAHQVFDTGVAHLTYRRAS
ncbi:dihydrofolate reductase [Pseudonocardiaceae bacterium YIM PH 21723]|nr:dihydrofolate reductase [Pseudonocardiaceae bacterium YIM PH 21723]